MPAANSSIGNLLIKVGINTNQLSKGARKVERDLKRMSRNLGQVANSINSTITLPFAAAAAASLKLSTDLETSFSKIENLVGVSGKEMEMLRKGARRLSAELGRSQKDLSEALFTITSAGLDANQALELLEASAKASAIGMGDTQQIAKAAAAAITAYKDSNLTSADAVDTLTAAVKAGNLTAEELAPSIGKVLPIASQLGISFAELTGNVASFSRLGVKASESVSALKALLGNILKPSKEAEKALGSVRLTIEDVKDAIAKQGLAQTLVDLQTAFKGNTSQLSQLFGSVEGLANALGTAGAQGEDYLAIVKEIENANGIVDKGFAKVSETAGFKFNQALVSLQNSAIELGNIMLPVAKRIADRITSAANAFTNLNKPLQEAIIKVGTFASGTGIALLAVSKITRVAADAAGAFKNLALFIGKTSMKMRTLNAVTKASVLGLVAAAIGGLVYLFSQFNDELTDAEKGFIDLEQAQKEASVSTAAETAKLARLKDVLNDTTASEEKRKEALEDLKRISPSYFGNLTTEADKLDTLNEKIEQYIDNLVKSAQIKILETRINEAAEAIAKLETEGAKLSVFEKFGQILLGSGNISSQIKASELKEALEQSIKQSVDQIESLKVGLPPISTEDTKGKGTGSGIISGILKDEELKGKKAEEDFIDRLSGRLKSIPERVSTVLDASLASKLQPQIESLKEVGSPFEILKSKVSGTMSVLENMGAVFGDVFNVPGEKLQFINSLLTDIVEGGYGPDHPFIQFLQGWKTEIEGIITASSGWSTLWEGLKSSVESAGDAMKQAAMSGASSLKELGKAALEAAKSVLRAAIIESIASVMKTAFAKLGIFGAPIAAAAAAAVGALFNKVIGGVKTPSFAEGGLVYGPTTAIVGDNPNSRIDPEVIAPLSKLRNMLPGIDSKMNFKAEAVLRGDDILIVMENAMNNRNRLRGF